MNGLEEKKTSFVKIRDGDLPTSGPLEPEWPYCIYWSKYWAWNYEYVNK